MAVRRKKKSKPDGFRLNFEPLPVAESLQDLVTLIYGAEKIGKTTLARQFPNPYFLFCEPGHKSLPSPTYGMLVRDWTEVRGVVRNIGKFDVNDFGTFVVDTADLAFDMCMDYICAKLIIDYPRDDNWGADWKAISKEFSKQLVGGLQKSGQGVVYLSHSKEVEIRTAAGGKRDKTVPTMSNSARRVLEPTLDLFACYDYAAVGGGRQLMIRGNKNVAAGTRCRKHFVGLTAIPMGKSEEEAFVNFVRAYNNESIAVEEPKKRKKRKGRR